VTDPGHTPAAEHPPEPGGAPVLVGVVAAAHGTEGALRVLPQTDNPERFSRGAQVWVGGEPHTVHDAVPAPPLLLVRLRGVRTRAGAAALVGKDITVPAEALDALPPDTYYHYQLIGMAVRDADGNALGTLTEVLETGANDVYVVGTPEQEWLIPAIAGVVTDVDVAGAVMTVALPDGLEPRPLRTEPKRKPPRRRAPRRRPAGG
jgi:16S rRNA processing protein RimM